VIVEPSCEPDPLVRWWGCFRFPLARCNDGPTRRFHSCLRIGNVSQQAPPPSSVARLMGSLIKKRRKRMRKKKHKKMLKRTRFQRRAKGK
jgi:hypothetical protein